MGRIIEWIKKYRYPLCFFMSAAASLMSFVNPLLAGLFVSRFILALGLPHLAPVAAGILFVNGVRMLLRSAVSGLMRGRDCVPLVRMQSRLGRRMWWLEPMLHRWGVAGWLVKRLGIAASAASFFIYTVTDMLVTFLAGSIFYYTRSYALSLLAALLPALEVAPWYAEKRRRFHKIKKALLRQAKN